MGVEILFNPAGSFKDIDKRNESSDIILDMDEPRKSGRAVSGFERNGNDSMRYETLDEDEEGRTEASSDDSSRTSNASSSLLSTRKSIKSRLMERSPDVVPMSGPVGKSGRSVSGFSAKTSDGDDPDDDPFAGEDVPDELRRTNFNAWTLLQWASLILIVAAFICSIRIPYLKRMFVWELRLRKWLVLILVLICGRLVSGWVIRLTVFFIEMNFLLRKKVLYFVYGVRNPVQNCCWLALVLLAWSFLFDDKVGRESRSKFLGYISKILECFVLGTLLWLIKTLIVKVMASSFHVKTYFDRIQETLFNQHVIQTLSGSPLIEVMDEEEDKFRKWHNADLEPLAFPTDGISQHTFTMRSTRKDDGIGIEHLHKLTQKNISAWNMKRLMKMVRYGTLTTLDEQIMDQPSGNQITSEHEATAAAKRIFRNVAKRGSKFIYLEDLMRFMPEGEAVRTMSMFEAANEKRRISKSSLKNWVVNSYRERRAIALTLNDTKTAVNKLHQMVNVITVIIITVIWLVILDIATSNFIVFFTSQLVLVAFIFGNTCKTIFESIIFLFIIHPFDVGDRCEVDGVQMVVEEMNILTTIFLRHDNLKMVLPNSLLASRPIGNFYRSPDMTDVVEFFIHMTTPVEKVALMKQRIISYVDSRNEYWCSSPLIITKELEDINKLRMSVWLFHKMNHQNVVERWERRGRLLEEMVNIFKDLDMQYHFIPIDINVCTMPPITSTRMPSTWPNSENSPNT